MLSPNCGEPSSTSEDKNDRDGATLCSNTRLSYTSILFDERVDGVILDFKARFFVSNFRDLHIDGTSALQEKHKLCKV